MTDEEITRRVTYTILGGFQIDDHVYSAEFDQVGRITILVPEDLASDHRPYLVRWDVLRNTGFSNWCRGHDLTLI